MRELDRALFPPASPGAGAPWIAEGTPLIDRGEPQVSASGMPPAAPALGALAPEPVRDLSWLRQLTMPDLPVRWDARVVRYLEFYKHNPRGRSMVAGWLKKSGRYGGAIRRALREQQPPGGHRVAGPGRERVRSHHLVARRRRRHVAVHARRRAHLRADGGPMGR